MAARGRRARALRREDDPDRRALRAAEALPRRRDAGRRRREHVQRAEPRRDPHGDEDRACSRRRRSSTRSPRRTSPPRRSAATPSATARAGPTTSTTRRATSAPRPSAASRFFFLNEPFRMLTGGRGLQDEMKTEAGHLHMKQLAELPEAQARAREVRVRRQAHVHQGAPGRVQRNGPRGRISPRTWSWPTPTCAATSAPRSTATRARRSVRRRSTRWSTTRAPGAAEALHPPRELRALQDLRHRRSVPGDHLDAARGRRGARLHADVGAATGARDRDRAPTDTGTRAPIPGARRATGRAARRGWRGARV